MTKIRDLEHDSHAAIEITDRRVRMIAIHGLGPRIAFFGRGPHNLLFWDAARVHRRGGWSLRGGHRLWVTRPGADESEETYAADDRPCTLRRLPDGAVITAAPDASRIEKSMSIRVRDGVWRIEHRLRNVGDMLWAGGAWALTCTLPRRTTRYRIPLDGGSARWDALTMVIPRRWGGGHTSRLRDPQIAFSEDAVEFRPRGAEAKRMLSAPRGALEMIDPVVGNFRKAAPWIAGARYPLDTNVAFYLGPRRFMVELETMSPMRTLAPGEALSHVESWTLSRA